MIVALIRCVNREKVVKNNTQLAACTKIYSLILVVQSFIICCVS